MASAAALAVSIGAISPASADVQPRSTDAVGVGSDTVQYVADFVDDGSPSGASGYNKTNTNHRVFSFDATADASGRAGYARSSTTALASTLVPRAGAKPIVRPNGSGAGITALLADSTHQLDFVRSSRLPKLSEQQDTRATASTFGGLYVYQIATDGLQVAEFNTASSHVPNGLLTASVLASIYDGTYRTWGAIPGYNGSAPNDEIIPILPQAGSGTRTDFIASLNSASGDSLDGGTGSTPFNPSLQLSEEHDPTALNIASGTASDGHPYTNADTIAPFSTGRDKLIDTGYFGTTPAPNTITLLGGPSDTTQYYLQRHLYIIVRGSDVNAAGSFQAGGTQNLVQTLFGAVSASTGAPTNWYGKSSNAGLYTAAGVTQSWADLGVVNS